VVVESVLAVGVQNKSVGDAATIPIGEVHRNGLTSLFRAEIEDGGRDAAEIVVHFLAINKTVTGGRSTYGGDSGA